MVSLIYTCSRKREGENLLVQEVVRFISITGIATSPILLFFITDVGVGLHSPVGLIIGSPLEEQGVPQLENKQWVLHIGGTQNNNYATGLSVPFYVIAFGILGGYLRYLYITYEKRGHHRKGNEEYKESPDDFLHDTLSELAGVLLAPFLAVAVWFILFQGDISSNPYIAAAVSFTLGLVTDEVIKGLVSFARGRIPKGESDSETGLDSRRKIKPSYIQ
jgi:hypothetical protein